MRNSLRLGTLFGIPVYLHWTFLLLLGFIAFSRAFASGSVTAALGGVVFVSAIFACVVLHEFGHVLGLGDSESTGTLMNRQLGAGARIRINPTARNMPAITSGHAISPATMPLAIMAMRPACGADRASEPMT